MRKRTAALVIAVTALTGTLGGFGIYALASPSQTGPVIVSNIPPGPYYTGQVNLCVNPATRKVYAETHTLQVGNCASGWVQLPVNSPEPAVTATVTVTPSVTTTVTVTPSGSSSS